MSLGIDVHVRDVLYFGDAPVMIDLALLNIGPMPAW